jgi:methylthioribose-1-phosphate isomerase
MESIRWDGHCLHLLDQRQLPQQSTWLRIQTWEQAAEAIGSMAVRGAPAIAITAGYGLALAVAAGADRKTAAAGLMAARPTAVNLGWALQRLSSVQDTAVASQAVAIHQEDLRINLAIGSHGAPLLSGGVLTICNTGALATGGHGTALGMIRSAVAAGTDIHTYALETRPYLQGARLTAYECQQDGLPCTLLPDSAAGALLQKGGISAVVVGCDRVAANGDTANKIGTYGLAVLAHHHSVPLYVAMPTSTLDRACPSGAQIPVEQRPAEELTAFRGIQIAPVDTQAWNPGFDITPAALISGWVTEHGMWTPDS